MMKITIKMLDNDTPWIVENIVEVIVYQSKLEFKLAGGEANIPLIRIESAKVEH